MEDEDKKPTESAESASQKSSAQEQAGTQEAQASQESGPDEQPMTSADAEASPESGGAGTPAASDPRRILEEVEKGLDAPLPESSTEPADAAPASVVSDKEGALGEASQPAEALLTEAMQQLDQLLKDIRSSLPTQEDEAV